MSTTSKFLKVFEPDNSMHVDWLSRMMTMAENIGDSTNIVKDVNNNPMGIVLEHNDALDWPHIHFVLCAAYAKAVLNGTAYVPMNSSNRSL